MTAIVQSAGYFSIDGRTNRMYGVITLASGQSERRVLCRKHAYLQLRELQAAGQVDEFEAMHITAQIGDSSLPLLVPDEFEGDIQDLITAGEDAVRSVFATDYFHPAVEEFLGSEVVDVPSRTIMAELRVLQ